MISLRSIFSDVIVRFTSHFKYPRIHAEELLCDLLDCSRSALYLRLDDVLTKQQYQTCLMRVERHMQDEPLAYIHGQVEFYGCKLQVNPSVLIPRQETEILVDRVVKHLSKENLSGKVLCDLCCGSGCIGIALKKSLPELRVILVDCSAEALVVAMFNAQINQVEVSFLQGDLLTPLIGQKMDFIVCNPPYLSKLEYANVEKTVRDYEPRLALIGGETGFEFYERLALLLPQYLCSGGRAWLEIGFQQGTRLLTLFNASCWKQKQLENDWAGHHRFFFLENE